MMNNKKIALVTCYFQKNYGSQLQAFATQMVFDKLKLENETIMVDGFLSEINKAKYIYFISRIFDINTIKDKMATVRKQIAKKQRPDYAKNLGKRYEMFEQFARTKFKLSRRYNSKAELSKSAHHYAAFVVGSDQLWLPSNIAADYYTLNFVPDGITKIALATSFGVSVLPKKFGRLASKFLNRIDYVSIREQSGQHLVKQWAGREVPIVCDPTILFTADEWMEALGAKEDGRRFASGDDYMLVYLLGNNPWQRELIGKIRESTGLKIVQIAHCDEFVKGDIGFADFTPYNVGPKEFVELIRDAKYVFTDSFHCSVFSMLNNKHFYVFPRYSFDGPASTNGRLYSLLALVDCDKQIVMKGDIINLNSPVDNNAINEKLDKLRQYAWHWLSETLKASSIL